MALFISMGKRGVQPVRDEFTDLGISDVRKFQLRRLRDGFCQLCYRPRTTKRYCATHAAKASERALKYNARNPLKVAARTAVTRAMIRGDLVREKCEECDLPGQAHHDDYSKPLDVRWLCRRHHALKEGRKFR